VMTSSSVMSPQECAEECDTRHKCAAFSFVSNGWGCNMYSWCKGVAITKYKVTTYLKGTSMLKLNQAHRLQLMRRMPFSLVNSWSGSDGTYGFSKKLTGFRYSEVVVTYDGHTRKVYVEGQLTASDTPRVRNDVDTKKNFCLGQVGHGSFFRGDMQDVAIYDRALDPEEFVDHVVLLEWKPDIQTDHVSVATEATDGIWNFCGTGQKKTQLVCPKLGQTVATGVDGRYTTLATLPPLENVNAQAMVHFSVRAASGALVALSVSEQYRAGLHEMYEVAIGGPNNDGVCIREEKEGVCKAKKAVKGLLSPFEPRTFKLLIQGSVLRLERYTGPKQTDSELVLEWTGFGNIKAVKYVGINTHQGVAGLWDVCRVTD